MLIHVITPDNLEFHVSRKRFAVIHLDAEWNKISRFTPEALMAEADERFTDQVIFGFASVDEGLAHAIALEIATVPTIAYYRDGQLVDRSIGVDSALLDNIQRLVSDQPMIVERHDIGFWAELRYSINAEFRRTVDRNRRLLVKVRNWFR